MSAATAMRRIFNIISTKRSGHHAFIYWLMPGLSGRARFRNNAVIGERLKEEIAAFAAASQGQSDQVLVLNYEGVSPSGLRTAWSFQQGAGCEVRDILFLRDPLNLCASLIHRKAFATLDLLMLLRQLIAERDWLAHHGDARAARPIDLVFYNPWLSDSDYKPALAARLGLAVVSKSGTLSHHGGGSSFQDLDAVEDEEDVAKLTQRWKRYRGHRLFEALVGHSAFSPWFERLCAGDIADCLGRTDRDDERAAYIAGLRRSPRRHILVDRMLAMLGAEPQILQRIESATGKGKKRILLEAHLKALLPGRRNTHLP